MKHLPSLRQLQYFLALADHLHFGKAARQCAVTQSTLSVGISDLEHILGVQLAERTKRTVSLTHMGREMATRAQKIVQLATDMSDTAKASHGPLCGQLKLGVIPTIAPFLLPVALPAIRQNFPKLELQLIEAESAEIVHLVTTGELDAIVLALPFATHGLQHHFIMEDPFYLAVPSHHPLATATQVTLADFQDEPIILLHQGHCLRDHALSACSLSGHQQAKGFDGTSLQTIVQMVAGGLGVTILPEMAIRAGVAKNAGLVPIRLSAANASRQISLAWRSTSPRFEDFKLLGQFLSQK